MADENTPLTVPMNRLRVHPDNVRTVTTSAAANTELEASIKAYGLINPLSIVADTEKGDGYFLITAGQRRYNACRAVYGKRSTRALDCKIVDENHAIDISLSENMHRADMHPGDTYTAFAKLAAAGATETQIANQFGVTEAAVKRLLALGNLHPSIMEAFKADKIDMQCARAFTVAPPDVQAELFARLSAEHERVPTWIVRNALTEDAVAVHHCGWAKLILDDYIKAGLPYRTDLFEESHYLDDRASAIKLAEAKMVAETVRLSTSGWSWAEYHHPDTEEGIHSVVYGYTEHEPSAYEEKADEETGEVEEIEIWSDEQKAKLGCYVYAAPSGALSVRFGLSPKGESVAAAKGEASEGSDSAPAEIAPMDRSTGVLDDLLNKQRHHAFQRYLFGNDTGVIIKMLAWNVIHGEYGREVSIHNQTRHADEGVQTVLARLKLETPINPGAFMEKATDEQVHAAIAALTGLFIDPGAYNDENAIEWSVGVAWRPDAEYFSKLKRDQLLALLDVFFVPKTAKKLAELKSGDLRDSFTELFELTGPGEAGSFGKITAAVIEKIHEWVPPQLAVTVPTLTSSHNMARKTQSGDYLPRPENAVLTDFLETAFIATTPFDLARPVEPVIETSEEFAQDAPDDGADAWESDDDATAQAAE